MNSEPDIWAERARKIIEANTDNFAELIRLSGLDPRRQLRCANLSGVSFRGCDLRDFDFTGARLLGCDFTGARIKGARFDQAEIDRVRPEISPDALIWDDSQDWDDNLSFGGVLAKYNPLRKAADWDAYVRGWRRPQRLLSDSHLPIGAVFQDAPFGPEMVVIPPGNYMMGSKRGEHGADKRERPQHLVSINEAFAVDRYAITQHEFGEFVFAADYEIKDGAWIWDGEWKQDPSKSWHEPGFYQDPNHPVTCVSWDDAIAYVAWLGEQTGQNYRLLSEAEWEYCCRAGGTTPFWWGSFVEAGKANYNNPSFWRQRTVPVYAFSPNAFGLYQMHGNIGEWVEDRWHEDYEGAPADNLAWIAGNDSRRVLRGGSWSNQGNSLRAAFRSGGYPDRRGSNVGFRVARKIRF